MGLLSRILFALSLGAIGSGGRGAVAPDVRRRAERMRGSDDGAGWDYWGARSPRTATTFTPPIGAFFRRSAAKRAQRARRGCR